MAKIIAHIDLNAFFAAAECLRNPSLRGKPLIIGGKGRAGIVSTCSYEARKYGIHSGMPTFQALKLCPNVIIVPVDYKYYQMLSTSFFYHVKEYTSLIEMASIDECYADFTKPLENVKDMASYFSSMQNRLYKEMGLSASIGVSSNRWLAKMGSDLKKPMGLTFLFPKDIEKVLYPLPIESFWGIGKKTSPRLRGIGINTIGDLAKAVNEDEPRVKALLGKFLFTVKEWINGEGSDELQLERVDPKSIGASTTLPYDMSTFAEIRPSLEAVSLEVADRAKKAKKAGTTVTLTVKDTVGTFHLHTRNKVLDRATNDSKAIFEAAKELYMKEFDGNMEIRLVGVSLNKLIDPRKEPIQMSIFDTEETLPEDKTHDLIDEINSKLRKPLLKRASEADNRKKGN